MANRKGVETELRQLPSGYWAVFIDDTWMDASSPTREVAQAKLSEFLRKMKGAGK